MDAFHQLSQFLVSQNVRQLVHIVEKIKWLVKGQKAQTFAEIQAVT